MSTVMAREDRLLRHGGEAKIRGAPLLVVRIAEIEGRGRAVVASEPLRAGQIVIRDSPILLYSALPLTILPPPHQPQQQHYHNLYCSNCFRILQKPSIPTLVSCSSCSSALFCGSNCRSVALSSSHTPWVCQALTRLRDCPSPLQLHHHRDRQVQARFLVAAYNLALVSPSDFQTLLSLQGDCSSTAQPEEAALFLHFLISSLCPPLPSQNSTGFGFSLELTASLLAKDKLNAFGLMEPFSEDTQRSVRAYGIYPKACFFNHDCLPNACRFDYVDADSATQHNTDIIVRVIHDVPQGREICLSYFPVNLKYSDRQRRLRDDYGFTCQCDRCKVEANWSDEEDLGDDSNSDEEKDEELMDEDLDEHMDMADSATEDCSVVNRDDDFPHAYFFLRYMCNGNNCWGTLAPLPPSGVTPSSAMECNVCGNLKYYKELMDGDALHQ
ncbi:unnamed protein product [Ilex paraguariensis]|uniref:SET domain-containing protein n=1 Tax=Ilex paraguariensis TaxID=185542 RepID=A0ABC8QL00_9AQUA